MTLIAVPPTFKVSSFSMRLQTVQRTYSDPDDTSEQVIDRLKDRWMISLTLPLGPQEIAARNEAFLNALRGQTNTCNLWHMKRRTPLGTMQGTPTVVGQAAGNGTILINTTPGATLLAGDMIGISGLLLQVAQDCVANGSGLMTCYLVNRLRRDLPDGTPVIWDTPTAPFRKVSTPSFQYFYGYAEGVSIDFVEAI